MRLVRTWDRTRWDGTGRDGTGHVVPYCVWNTWDRTVDCTIIRLVWLGQDRTRGSNDQNAPIVIEKLLINNFIRLFKMIVGIKLINFQNILKIYFFKFISTIHILDGW